MTQFVGLTGCALLIGWTIISSAILVMHSLGAGNLKVQALRDQAVYEGRLNELAQERDARAMEAADAQQRFTVALTEVSAMQSRLLASEERRRELETGINVVQETLRSAMRERDEVRDQNHTLTAQLAKTAATNRDTARLNDLESTLDFVTAALGDVSTERDKMQTIVSKAEEHLDKATMDARLEEQRNERIFSQIEDAVTVSLDPINKIFTKVDLPTDRIIEQVRRSYSGQGGPLTPITFSTSGDSVTDPTTERANQVLGELDKLNLYRIALEKIPFSFPLKTVYRPTSPFGMRWGRMHEGQDLAGAMGSPIYATADGVVIFAGHSTGYGNLIRIRHDFGFETRYGHLSKIRVTVGQRVSLGDRIGDMGNTGHSTGTHLHYEVRVSGEPVNPMKYIKAARDVF